MVGLALGLLSIGAGAVSCRSDTDTATTDDGPSANTPRVQPADAGDEPSPQEPTEPEPSERTEPAGTGTRTVPERDTRAVDAGSEQPFVGATEAGRDGNPSDRGSASLISSGEQYRFSRLWAGETTCGKRADDGTLICWGANPDGLAQAPKGPFKQVALSKRGCGLLDDGRAVCWPGANDAPDVAFASLSVGPRTDSTCGIRADGGGVLCWGEEAIAGLEGESFSSLSVGTGHACGIRESDGIAKCWGASATDSPPDIAFETLVSGTGFTCGLRKDDHHVECWGIAPQPVPDDAFTLIDAGAGQVCGLRDDGRVLCWGRAASGSVEGNLPPPTDAVFDTISVGDSTSCGLRKDDGAVQCWGLAPQFIELAPPGPALIQVDVRNRWGGLCVLSDKGVPHCPDFSHPPPTGLELTSVTTFTSACGIRASDGHLECWGSDLPQSAPDLAFSKVQAGESQTCGLVRDTGELLCWRLSEPEATQPLGGSFSTFSIDADYGCALRAEDGVLECWGAVPFEPPTGVGFNQLDTGHRVTADTLRHACAIRSDDSGVQCWGDDDAGQATAPSGGFVEVAVGLEHSCGIREDDAGVQCWGDDSAGQVTSAPAGEYTTISAGGYHTCAIEAKTGHLRCWGDHWR